MVLPLIAVRWLLASLTNLAPQPTINLIGEIFIVIASFQYDITIILMGVNIIITTLYSLYLMNHNT